jgi:signal transduction histidine kinase
MDPVAEFFTRNIVIVYFFYGLAFFTMGLVVWLESNRTSEFRIARAFGLLAGFGMIHGLHEWFEMFEKISEAGATSIPGWLLLPEVRLSHLVISFILLTLFGVRLLFSNRRNGEHEQKFVYLTAGGLFFIFLVSVLVTYWVYKPERSDFIGSIDVLSRYILGIPGALVAAWAIVLEQRALKKRSGFTFGRDLQWAAWALLLYGVIGQSFPKETFLFPSTVINSQLFLELFGIPVQLFRAMEAIIMAVFFIQALRKFELERQKRLTRDREARIEAQQKMIESEQAAKKRTEILNRELKDRELMLAELLHQVVNVQESERQRIARELHDGAGQILTGLGLGLAAASETVSSNPELAAQQLVELRQLNSDALRELHAMIRDLRPSVLDDLGLVAALKAQAREFEDRTGVSANFKIVGKRSRLRPELETVVFRIGQEALTNVAKHALADSVNILLNFNENCLKLRVEDNGRGFDPQNTLQPGDDQRKAWGLLGIQERVALVGGACFILSKPGEGTTIHVTVPITDARRDDVEDQPDIS